jgi:hypothetical protein
MGAGSNRRLLRTVLAVAAALSLTACSSSLRGGGMGAGGVGSDGATSIGAGELATQLDALPTGTLSAEQEAGLLQMREEEKLAHDVYVALHEQWNVQVFDNISSAEQTHADAVGALLERYGLADPSAGRSAGEFASADIAALYTSLVAQGQASLVDALTVGATIEDLDIADLRALATDAPDIALVYSNLERGSRNHLRAFTKQLQKSGASYTPTYISQADYDAIISTDTERGNGS